MGLFTAIVQCLRKSFDWSGRARRSEFWQFTAFWIVVTVASTYAVDQPPRPAIAFAEAIVTAPVMLVPLFLFVPLGAVAVRRMHDIDLSGWWLLSIGIPIPVLDALVVGAQMFCFARPGTEGDNRFGPDPRRQD